MSKLLLTERFVNSRKPAPVGQRLEYRDAGVPGLALRVTDKGSKSYVLIARYPSSPKNPTRRTLGEAGVLTLVQARAKAREWLDVIGRRIDPRAEEIRRHNEEQAGRAEEQARATTFSAVAKRFLDQHIDRGSAPKYAREVRRILEHDVLPRWGARPIREITKQDVIDLLEAKADTRERKRKGSRDDAGALVQANRTLTRLRTLYRWSVAENLAETDPTEGVRRRVKEAARDRALSDDEIRWFWSGCEAAGWPFGPLFKLLLLTAQRRDEVAAMQWAEINLEGRLWTIPREKTKSDRGHEVQLSALAIEIIEALPKAGRFMFSTNGARSVSGFSRAKLALDRRMAAQKRAEHGDASDAIEGWILHDLRRTAATGMARLNIAPHVVDRILNHVSGAIRGVAAIYNRHAYLEERRAALEVWGRYVESLVRPAAPNVISLLALS